MFFFYEKKVGTSAIDKGKNPHCTLKFLNMAVTLIFSINLKVLEIMLTLEWLWWVLVLGQVLGT